MSLKAEHPSYRARAADGRFESDYRRSIDGVVKRATERARRHRVRVFIDHRDELVDGTPLGWSQLGYVDFDPETGEPGKYVYSPTDQENQT